MDVVSKITALGQINLREQLISEDLSVADCLLVCVGAGQKTGCRVGEGQKYSSGQEQRSNKRARSGKNIRRVGSCKAMSEGATSWVGREKLTRVVGSC